MGRDRRNMKCKYCKSNEELKWPENHKKGCSKEKLEYQKRYRDSETYKKWYIRTKNERNLISKQWAKNHPDKVREYTRKNSEKIKKASKKRDKELRYDAIKYYSKNRFECRCCLESNYDFLTIDHVNNNGVEHRKQDPKANHLYRWLKNNKYPKGFQVLCYNCNVSIFRLGKCFHYN